MWYMHIYTYIYISTSKSFAVILFFIALLVCRNWHDVKNVQNARACDSVLEIAGDDVLWKMLPGKDGCAVITAEINNFCEANAFLSILPLLEKKKKIHRIYVPSFRDLDIIFPIYLYIYD